jgi:hypothetical protein
MSARTPRASFADCAGASDFNDPAALGRLHAATKGADILIGRQSMTNDAVERHARFMALERSFSARCEDAVVGAAYLAKDSMDYTARRRGCAA